MSIIIKKAYIIIIIILITQPLFAQRMGSCDEMVFISSQQTFNAECPETKLDKPTVYISSYIIDTAIDLCKKKLIGFYFSTSQKKDIELGKNFMKNYGCNSPQRNSVNEMTIVVLKAIEDGFFYFK